MTTHALSIGLHLYVWLCMRLVVCFHVCLLIAATASVSTCYVHHTQNRMVYDCDLTFVLCSHVLQCMHVSV